MTSSYRQYVKVQDSEQSWTSGQPHRTWCSQGSPTLGFVLCACDLRLLNFTETVYCKRSNGTMEHASGTCSLSPRVSCHLLLVFDLFLGHYSPTQVCPPPHILSQSNCYCALPGRGLSTGSGEHGEKSHPHLGGGWRTCLTRVSLSLTPDLGT